MVDLSQYVTYDASSKTYVPKDPDTTSVRVEGNRIIVQVGVQKYESYRDDSLTGGPDIRRKTYAPTTLTFNEKGQLTKESKERLVTTTSGPKVSTPVGKKKAFTKMTPVPVSVTTYDPQSGQKISQQDYIVTKDDDGSKFKIRSKERFYEQQAQEQRRVEEGRNPNESREDFRKRVAAQAAKKEEEKMLLSIPKGTKLEVMDKPVASFVNGIPVSEKFRQKASEALKAAPSPMLSSVPRMQTSLGAANLRELDRKINRKSSPGAAELRKIDKELNPPTFFSRVNLKEQKRITKADGTNILFTQAVAGNEFEPARPNELKSSAQSFQNVNIPASRLTTVSQDLDRKSDEFSQKASLSQGAKRTAFQLASIGATAASGIVGGTEFVKERPGEAALFGATSAISTSSGVAGLAARVGLYGVSVFAGGQTVFAASKSDNPTNFLVKSAGSLIPLGVIGYAGAKTPGAAKALKNKITGNTVKVDTSISGFQDTIVSVQKTKGLDSDLTAVTTSRSAGLTSSTKIPLSDGKLATIVKEGRDLTISITKGKEILVESSMRTPNIRESFISASDKQLLTQRRKTLGVETRETKVDPSTNLLTESKTTEATLKFNEETAKTNPLTTVQSQVSGSIAQTQSTKTVKKGSPVPASYRFITPRVGTQFNPVTKTLLGEAASKPVKFIGKDAYGPFGDTVPKVQTTRQIRGKVKEVEITSPRDFSLKDVTKDPRLGQLFKSKKGQILAETPKPQIQVKKTSQFSLESGLNVSAFREVLRLNKPSPAIGFVGLQSQKALSSVFESPLKSLGQVENIQEVSTTKSILKEKDLLKPVQKQTQLQTPVQTQIQKSLQSQVQTPVQSQIQSPFIPSTPLFPIFSPPPFTPITPKAPSFRGDIPGYLDTDLSRQLKSAQPIGETPTLTAAAFEIFGKRTNFGIRSGLGLRKLKRKL